MSPSATSPRSHRASSLATTMIFMSSELLDGDFPVAALLREGLASIFVETDSLFRFRINPNQLTVRKSKLQSSTFTKSGYVYSFHGNDMTKLTYRGSTGYFRPLQGRDVTLELMRLVPGFPLDIQDAGALAEEASRLVLAGQIDITRSPVWQKFRRFEAFWDRVQKEMLVYCDLRLYRGELISFNYTEDANDPFRIQYDFDFHAHTDSRTGSDRFGRALVQLGVR